MAKLMRWQRRVTAGYGRVDLWTGEAAIRIPDHGFDFVDAQIERHKYGEQPDIYWTKVRAGQQNLYRSLPNTTDLASAKAAVESVAERAERTLGHARRRRAVPRTHATAVRRARRR